MLTTTVLGLKKPQTTDQKTALRTAISDNADIVEALTSTARVTSIPSTGLYDGREISYVADGTNGVLWQLRYNASGGTYKWEFVGGGSLTDENLFADVVPSTSTYADGTHPGPSITVPLAGDYEITMNAELSPTALVGVALQIGATVPTYPSSPAMLAAARAHCSRTRRVTVPAASTVVTMVYVSPSGSTSAIDERNLTIRPIRVA